MWFHRFFRSKHTGSDTIIDDYVLQMWETFQLSRGTHEVEQKHVDEIIEEDKNIRGGDRHCKNCTKKIRFLILQMKTHKVELVKNVKKKSFWFYRWKIIWETIMQNIENSKQVVVFFRLMQRMWGIGNSWRISWRTREGGACAGGGMTHLRKVNLWWSDWRNNLGRGSLSGKWGIPEKLCLMC